MRRGPGSHFSRKYEVRKFCGRIVGPGSNRVFLLRLEKRRAAGKAQQLAMHPLAAVASLLALLAANGTSTLDCACDRIAIEIANAGAYEFSSHGEAAIWFFYCRLWKAFDLPGLCETLESPSVAVAAVARLVPWYWSYASSTDEKPIMLGPQSAGEEECDVAMEALRSLTDYEALNLFYSLPCHIATDCIKSCSAQGLNDTKWSVETLTAERLRQPALSQSLHALRRILRAKNSRHLCANIELSRRGFSNHGSKEDLALFLEVYSNYTRDLAQLLSLAVPHVSRVFIPLAFAHVLKYGNNR